MSIIYSYPEQGALNANDLLIGTSAEKVGGKQKNITRNFSIQQIADFINRGAGFVDPVASDFQIPVFNQEGKKITGSIMSQDSSPSNGAAGSAITIAGSLVTTGNLTSPGVVTIGGGTNLITLNSETYLKGSLRDSANVLGADKQILLSDQFGYTTWTNYEAGLTYEGTWDANANTTNGLSNSPALLQGAGVSGHFYIVNVEGTTSLGPGLNDWHVGDWAIFLDEGGQPASWQKIDNTSTLVGSGTAGTFAKWTNATTLNDSIMSESGTVVSVDGDLKVKDTIQATTGPSSSLKLKGVGTGGVEIMSADGVTDGKITLNCSQNSHGVTLQSPPHASGATYTLILPTSFGGAGDVLTSAGANPSQLVWTTPTTGTVTGTGTENYVTKWSAGGTGIENSTIFDNGTNVGIGTTSPTEMLTIAGNIKSVASGQSVLKMRGGGDSSDLNLTSSFNSFTIKRGSDERMRIASNGDVGIGTTSPSAKLEVDSGTTNVTSIFKSSDNQAWISIQDDASGTYGALIGTDTDAGNDFAIADQSSQKTFVINSGNVGIGTDSPGAKLEVAGDILSTGDITIDNSTGDPFLKLKTNAQEYVIRIDQSDAEKFQIRDITNSLTPFTIDSSGNVGIGTASPSEKLDVTGNISLAGSVIHVGDTNTSFGFHGNDLFRVVTGGTERFEVSNSGIIINDGGSDYDFRVESDNNASMLFVDGGNDRVGIGTSSPTVSLDISATDAVQMPVGITNDRPTTGVSNGMLRYNSTNNGFEGYINGNWGDIGGGTSGGLIFRGTFDASTGAIASGGSLYTCPAGGSGGTVDTAIGDLYIVTTAGSFFCSGTSLNVGDEVICITAATATNDNVNNWNAIASGAGGAITGSGTTNYVPKFTGATVVGNSSIFNDASGNVGIGTASPSRSLDVNSGNQQISALIESTSSLSSQINIKNGNSSNGGFVKTTGDNIILSANNSGLSHLVVADGGNVGIGTTNPGATLQVGEATNITGALSAKAKIVVDAANNTDINNVLNLISKHNGSPSATADSGPALLFSGGINDTQTRTYAKIVGKYRGSNEGGLAFHTQDTADIITEKMTILPSSGNVGIGTDNPSGLLHVSSGTSGDAVVIIESDTDNNNENDNPQLQFKQDGGSTIAKAGLTGDAGTIFTDSLANSAYFGNEESAALQLYTNTTARLTIEPGGNVGIGTSNPGAKLEVKNGSSGQVYSNVEGILIDTNGNSNSDYSLRIGSSAGNDNLVVTNAGRVGIGTDSPEVSLDLGNNTDAIRVPNGAQADRPSGILPGMIRYNTSSNEFEGYSGTLNVSGSWGALGGGSLPTKTVDTFTGSGQSFIDLTVEASSVNYIDMYIDGVYQAKATYTIATPGGTGISRLTLVSGTFPTGVSIETVTTT